MGGLRQCADEQPDGFFPGIPSFSHFGGPSPRRQDPPAPQRLVQRLLDTQFKKNAVRLLPGESFYTPKDLLLVTTLGSCVSACIRDPTTGIGGMNHFMLPENGQKGGGGWSSTPIRFGAYAMEVLINSLIKAGARREQLEAKLFGGGAVLRNMGAFNVGRKNGTFAL
uniref:Putative MCP protein methylation stimulating protein (CheD) n=1 Tax=Leptospirillum ferrodiazotrophum TaxID=412449 RepID=C6HYK2_9BACT|nr:MAG: putative MCP protein methylation stimulating protein (CheD) [Leptospirillum ferrodiazotrophum]